MLPEGLNEFSEAKRKLFFLAVVFVGIFLFGTISIAYIKNIAYKEAFTITIETLAFVHKVEETGSIKLIQIFLLIFGGFFLWFSLWTSFDIVLEGHFNKHFKEARIMKNISKLKDHYVICGGGRVGMHVAELLKKKKEKFVIIEKEEYLVKEALRKNFLVLEGDALEEAVLKEARVNSAKAVIAVLRATEKNILAILTAKEINPDLKVYARCSRTEYVKKLKKAGADFVFMPELTCAEEIVQKLR